MPVDSRNSGAVDLSIVIPSRDRPLLLRDAVQSVASQAGPDREIVIVDDASEPRVDVARLRSDFGVAIRVVRNEHSLNVCVARDQGVRAAQGEVILHMDDDDRLADGALEMVWGVFRQDPALNLLFLGVRGFGPNADQFDEAQARGVRRIRSDAGGEANGAGLIKFDERLFPALLVGVPMAFQRFVVQRRAWDTVSNFRRRIYAEPQLDAGEDPLLRVPPLWNESEWAIYASVLCRTALLDRAPYLQRCAGQGYFSVGNREAETVNTRINMMNRLGHATRTTKEFASWARLVREHRGRAHMNRAYSCLRHGDRMGAMASLLDALSISPRWEYTRFLVNFVRPVSRHRG